MANYNDLTAIANNGTFQGRVLYALTLSATNVMAEVKTTQFHWQRGEFAAKVLSGSLYILPYCLAVLANPTVAAEAVLATTPDYAIPDADIQFAVNSLWNAFSGVF